MLLLPPAGGDELQGIKKGIMEHVDLICINKSDGDLVASAQHMQADIRRALQVSRRASTFWMPKVERCSALLGEGVDNLWTIMQEYESASRMSGNVSAEALPCIHHPNACCTLSLLTTDHT